MMRTPIVCAALAFCAVQSARAGQLLFTEVHYNPAGSAPEFLEVTNITPRVFDIADWKLRGGVSYDLPGFSDADAEASFLKSYERVIFAGVSESVLRSAYPTLPAEVRVFGPWSGNLSNGGESVSLEDKNGFVVATVDYGDGGEWPVAADGTGHSLELVSIYLPADAPSNWRASLAPGGTPGAPIQEGSGLTIDSPLNLLAPMRVAELGSTWRVYDESSAPPADWASPGFDDGGWREQGGYLNGFETRELPDPGLPPEMPAGNLARDSASGLLAYYFRRDFDFTGGTQGAQLNINAVLDDGMVVYLNGNEVGRVRMPDGAITWSTPGQSATETGVEPNLITADISSWLVEGRNVLAVEVHNESAGSSDVVFGMEADLSPGQFPVVINEAAPGASGFVEFTNNGPVAVNLGGYYLSDSAVDLTKYAIPAPRLIAPGSLVTISFSEAGLSPNASNVNLVHPNGTTVVESVGLDIVTNGRSVGRKPAGSGDWYLFSIPTPGASNGGSGDLAGLLAVNEVHLGAGGSVDWVEVTSLPGAGSVDLAGLGVASRRDFSDRVPLSGILAEGGFASADVAFAVAGEAEFEVYLVSDSGVVIDAVRLDRRPGPVAGYQADPPGSGEFYAGPGSTRDAANAPNRQTSIVINEIMSDPLSDARNGEYIELLNRGGAAVDLGGWSFTDGIGFEFPAGTSLAPGGFAVVAANAAWIGSEYGVANVFGNFSGNLANKGERVRLEDGFGNLADQVEYGAAGNWPTTPNGDGSSLELVHPDADNSVASSWAPSDESGKSEFQSYSFTGRYEQFSDERIGSVTDFEELHLHLVGDAHIALRNIRLERDGANILENANQDTPNGSSATGWLSQGTHYASHFEGDVFHLISDGHGDNRCNKAEIDATAMERGDTLTIRFDARWISGKPRLIVQTFDHSFCYTPLLPVPNNLGTPGAANSRARANPPAGLTDLMHSPVVPSSADDVTVTARVSAPAGTNVELLYRPDSVDWDNAWLTAPMNDSGTGPDETAGDGLFSGVITNQKTNGQVVQFYVRATTAAGEVATLPTSGPNPPAMYVVDDQTVESDVSTVRWVVSDQSYQHWRSGSRPEWDYKFPNLSNSYKPLTLVVDETHPYYNCEVRPSGSPWHAGDRATLLRRGKFRLPEGSPLRGVHKLSWDNTPAAEGAAAIYHNMLARYWLYLMGHETNNGEFVTIIENNQRPRRSVELFEVIGNDFLDRNWEDGSKGELYRIDDIFRFDDRYNKAEITNRFFWYAGDQWEGPGRYHTQWLLRSNETAYDYSALINLLKTMSEDSYSEDEINRLLDPDRFAMMCAVRGYIADWDTITLNRPKNSFFYRPPGDGKFRMFHHDSDLAYQSSHISDQLVATHGNNRELRNWIRRPENQRKFRYYLAEMMDKWTSGSARLNAWFALEEEASSEYRVNDYDRTWFRGRARIVDRELGTNWDLPLTAGTPVQQADGSFSITGEAGYRVWETAVVGHPEAAFAWTGETTWRIDGIRVPQGANELTVVGLDDDGDPAFEAPSAELTINQPSDGTPVAVLDTSPGSGRIGLGEAIVLDASDSYDPEGQALAFSWTPPAVGVAGFIDRGDGTASVSFDRPGLFTFSLEASDGEGPAGGAAEEVSVYGPGGFTSFNDPVLGPEWTAENAEALDNNPTGAWYTLDINPGRLTVQLPEQALPQAVTFSHPWIKRPLPSDGNWVVETELELVGTQYGPFEFGLMLSVQEGAAVRRLSLSFEDGDTVSVKSISPTGVQEIASADFSASDDIRLRARRSGNMVFFEWRADGDDPWTGAGVVNLAAGATGLEAGVFGASSAPQVARATFDYVMVIDPVLPSPFRGQIVLSEIMYKPDGGSDEEYLELLNTTAGAISLEGFKFPQGAPFDEYTFGAVSLAPGQYGLLVSDAAAFTARYGAEAASRILGSWVGGGLNNAGEEITLLDPAGLVVFSVEYSDEDPWPEAPDTHGASLVLRDPGFDGANPESWSPSRMPGGSPGGDDTQTLAEWATDNGIADVLADTNGDGISELVAYALGFDLTSAGLADLLPVPGVVEVDGDYYGSISYRRRLGDETIVYSVESADQLSGWSAAPADTTRFGAPVYFGDGTEFVTERLTTPLPDAPVTQLRLRITQRE